MSGSFEGVGALGGVVDSCDAELDVINGVVLVAREDVGHGEGELGKEASGRF